MKDQEFFLAAFANPRFTGELASFPPGYRPAFAVADLEGVPWVPWNPSFEGLSSLSVADPEVF